MWLNEAERHPDKLPNERESRERAQKTRLPGGAGSETVCTGRESG